MANVTIERDGKTYQGKFLESKTEQVNIPHVRLNGHITFDYEQKDREVWRFEITERPKTKRSDLEPGTVFKFNDKVFADDYQRVNLGADSYLRSNTWDCRGWNIQFSCDEHVTPLGKIDGFKFQPCEASKPRTWDELAIGSVVHTADGATVVWVGNGTYIHDDGEIDDSAFNSELGYKIGTLTEFTYC